MNVITAIVICSTSVAVAQSDTTTLLLTADTQGHVLPCRSCPSQPGIGGLSRRATLVEKLRRHSPEALLLDAGNAFYGAESLESKGRIIVAAYNAMKYDAVNLSYRDFRLGKTATLTLIKRAAFPVISANLVDDATGELLAKPYVITKNAGRRVAIIGVTERPAALDSIPRLKKQLDSVTIVSPQQALTKWLPRITDKADQIILLYYGSNRNLTPIRKDQGRHFAAILVGSIRPDQLPHSPPPAVAGAAEKGRSLCAIQLTSVKSGLQAKLTQHHLTPDIKSHSVMSKLLHDFESTDH